jgi:deferrochelatase/peroxidase EfeB
MPDTAVDLADIQGNILRGYHKAFVRHLVLTVSEADLARQWLLDVTSGDEGAGPQVTTAEPWANRPGTCLNIGMTHAGLAALGVAPESLDSFPHEFAEGMASRAVKLGDTGASAPTNWKPEWRDPGAVHLVVSVHADHPGDLHATAARVLGAGAAAGPAFTALAQLDGAAFPDGLVHFGYRDGIAQPRFENLGDPDSRPDQQPLVEIGAVLLGHRTPVEDLMWEVPKPDVLGMHGCFNAFRVLEQRVGDYEQFLTDQAEKLLAHPAADELLPPGAELTWDPPLSRHHAMREVIGAKMLGRWRNGVPVVLSPTSPTPQPPVGPDRLNDFGYADDPNGFGCPMGSHIRRCNPRDGRIVQRSTNHSRRIVRRGIPYGPPFDPASPTDDERGLLGMFLCASLIVQFEAMQYDWINLGLQDPRITGANDPVIGNNEPEHSVFAIPVASGSVELRGFSRFVHTRGGAYLFIPSMRALRHLGGTDR